MKAKTAITEVKTAIRQSAEGFPLLGYCVYWSIREFKKPTKEVTDALAAAGIGDDVFAETRAKTAAHRAVKSVIKGKKETFSRKVLDGDGVAAFAVVNESVDAANIDIDFQTATKAVLDKDTGNFEVTGDNAQAIKDAFADFKASITSDQFRALVLRYLRKHCEAITVRENGGIYFVPSIKQAEYDRLVALFNAFAGSCSLEIIPVIDTAQARQSMWKAMTLDVQSEIAAFKKDLEDHGEDGFQDRAIRNRVEKFQRLKNMIENYELVLSGTANDLKSELDAITQKVKGMLLGG